MRLFALPLLVALASPARADQVMWKITVKDWTVQDLANGTPTGKPRAAAATMSGEAACAFDVEPKGVFHPWEDGSIDDDGKFRRSHHGGGAPEQVNDCTLGVFLNTKIPVPAGTYRVSATVTFKKFIYRD